MKGRFRKTTFVLAGILAVVLLLQGVLRPREPVYQGKRLSAWLRELDSWPGKSSEPAAKAIREIGTNALPYLVSALQADDASLKVKLSEFLGRLGLVKFQIRLAEERRDTACKALLILGPMASNAIPDIRRMFYQAKMTGAATLALFAIGGSSIPTLVEACHHTNQFVRAEAAFILCKLTPAGRRGYTTTYYPAGSTNPVSRFAMTIGDDDMAALGANLKDPLPAVRRASAEALGRHSGIAKPAVPALLKAMEDPDPEVRKAAAEALKTIDSDAAAKANLK
jgi:HEAT repeat protein